MSRTSRSSRSAASSHRRCPTCGGALQRVQRDGLDRWLSRFRPSHRYSCIDMQCGWTGRLAVAKTPSRLSRRIGPLPLGTWLAIGAVLALGAADGARRYVNAQEAADERQALLLAAAEPGPVPGRPAGWHYGGDPLPASDPRVIGDDSKLKLVHNCVWGDPGRNPYRGTPEQALKAAGLPPEVVREISAMIASGLTPDRVEIDSDGIRTADGRREFSPTLPAMAFGRSMCFNTVVNFRIGHVEPARLFEATDRTGRLWSVMVPSVCNNVSVITERPVEADDQGQVLGERAEDVDAPEDVRVARNNGESNNTVTTGGTEGSGGGSSRKRITSNGTKRVTTQTNVVPEPGTVAMVGLGLAVMVFTKRRRSRADGLKKTP